VNETMSKLYQRIQMNTTNYFSDILPATTVEWRGGRKFCKKERKFCNSLCF